MSTNRIVSNGAEKTGKQSLFADEERKGFAGKEDFETLAESCERRLTCHVLRQIVLHLMADHWKSPWLAQVDSLTTGIVR